MWRFSQKRPSLSHSELFDPTDPCTKPLNPEPLNPKPQIPTQLGVRQREEPMENGRIEPLRALPFIGGAALLTGGPILHTPQNLRVFQGLLALAGSPQLLTSLARRLPSKAGGRGRPPIFSIFRGAPWNCLVEAPGGPWRLLEASGGPPACLLSKARRRSFRGGN